MSQSHLCTNSKIPQGSRVYCRMHVRVIIALLYWQWCRGYGLQRQWCTTTHFLDYALLFFVDVESASAMSSIEQQQRRPPGTVEGVRPQYPRGVQKWIGT